MKRSLGFRFLMVSLLTILMFIPMFFVSGVVQDRKSYSLQTLQNVGNEWGGAQILSGPYLSIPVQETVSETRTEPVKDPETGVPVIGPDGKAQVRSVLRNVTVRRAPIIVFPNRFDLSFESQTQIRYRGIFKVPVYQADVAIDFDFPSDRIADEAVNNEVILWDQASMVLNLSNNAALRGTATLMIDGQDTRLEPLAQNENIAGIMAEVGDPRQLGGLCAKAGSERRTVVFCGPCRAQQQYQDEVRLG